LEGTSVGHPVQPCCRSFARVAGAVQKPPCVASVRLSHAPGCCSGAGAGIRSLAFVGVFTSASLPGVESACALLRVQRRAPRGRACVLRGSPHPPSAWSLLLCLSRVGVPLAALGCSPGVGAHR